MIRRTSARPPGLSFAHKALQIMGSRRSALDTARGRMVVVSAVFVLAYVLMAARIVDVTLIQGVLPRYAEGAAEKISSDVPGYVALRGDITDRNGMLLATSLETASLYADPAQIPDAPAVARELVSVFPDLSYDDVLQKLQRKARFIWIKRNLTPAQQAQALKLGHPGLSFKTEYTRIYPGGALAAHIVGYTDIDGRGLAGIERSFDRNLPGAPPQILTLDIRMQYILRRELARAVMDFGAGGGAGIIMDVDNGEVLGAVSLPDFDPQNVGATQDRQRFNNATQGVFEMGSTFKIFSTAALLELTGAKMSDTFDARQPLKIDGRTINDYHAQNRVLTIPEIFMHSSNIGAAKMGEKVGTQALRAFYSDLGLTSPPPLEIDEVGRPLVPNPWRDISTVTAAYGHGISVSPLQLVAAASSIVNGGVLVRPTLVLDKAQEKTPGGNAAVGKARIVSPETAHRMRQLLRLVVTDGTGKAADVPGYEVGGKTGTAEKSVNGRYDRGLLVSSFIGFFPITAPRYAVLILVDEPRGTKASQGYATAGWVAAPAAARVIQAMGPLVGLAPQNLSAGQDIETPLKQYVTFEPGKGGVDASFHDD